MKMLPVNDAAGIKSNGKLERKRKEPPKENMNRAENR